MQTLTTCGSLTPDSPARKTVTPATNLGWEVGVGPRTRALRRSDAMPLSITQPSEAPALTKWLRCRLRPPFPLLKCPEVVPTFGMGFDTSMNRCQEGVFKSEEVPVPKSTSTISLFPRHNVPSILQNAILVAAPQNDKATERRFRHRLHLQHLDIHKSEGFP